MAVQKSRDMLSQKMRASLGRQSQTKNLMEQSAASLTKHLRNYLSVHSPGRKHERQRKKDTHKLESQIEILQ